MDLFQLVAPQSIRDDRRGLSSTPTEPQHLGEVHERVRLRVDPVGSKAEIDSVPGEHLARVYLPTTR